jgi:hypothetical protein
MYDSHDFSGAVCEWMDLPRQANPPLERILYFCAGKRRLYPFYLLKKIYCTSCLLVLVDLIPWIDPYRRFIFICPYSKRALIDTSIGLQWLSIFSSTQHQTTLSHYLHDNRLVSIRNVISEETSLYDGSSNVILIMCSTWIIEHPWLHKLECTQSISTYRLDQPNYVSG